MSAANPTNYGAQARPNGVTPLSVLQARGVPAQDVARLEISGIFTVEAVAHATKKQLREKLTGVPDARIDSLHRRALDLAPPAFVSAADLPDARAVIETGAADLDGLLGGGIEIGAVTEVFGENRTGKTQLCHTLCVTAQVPFDQGGPEGKVVYLDTCDTFRPCRLAQIAARYGLGLKAVVDKITYAHVPNSELLLDYANRLLPELLHKDPHVLVIVDSAVGPLRTEFSFKESRQRQAELQRLMGALKNLTKNFGVAVLVTNQVVMHPHAPDAFGRTEDIKPCGGNVMAHASQTRVEFKVPRGLRRSDERVAELVASPHMPVGEATFRITQGGLQ